jgi:hypothetical protein
VITSPKSANGTVGKPFSYKITATNNPTSFGATGLPAGLTLSSSTGQISGSPKTAGNVQITVSATNAAGKGTLVVKLTVSKPAPPPTTKPPHSSPPHTKPVHSSGTPPVTSGTPIVTSGSPPPTSGDAMRFKSAWVPPPTYAIPPVPPVPPALPAAPLTDLGRQFLGGMQGSRKIGILAASGIVIQGLLAIVSMTDDGSETKR